MEVEAQEVVISEQLERAPTISEEQIEENGDEQVVLNSETLGDVVVDVTTSPPVPKSGNKSQPNKRLVRFPLARVKAIMKADPDCNIIAADAVFLTTKATELFVAYLSRESSKFAVKMKRKTLQKRDVDAAIGTSGNLFFLDGALD